MSLKVFKGISIPFSLLKKQGNNAFKKKKTFFTSVDLQMDYITNLISMYLLYI
jgi:hypothetical protein